MADADALREPGVTGVPSARTRRRRRRRRPATRRSCRSSTTSASCARGSFRSIIAVARRVGHRLLLRDADPRVPACGRSATIPLQVLGLGDAFVIQLKIAIVVGIILAMPVLLYQVWAFIAPGLTPTERQLVRPWIPLALLFFAIGVGIAYVVLPFAIQFLFSFTDDTLVGARRPPASTSTS